jgi:hypothetical protein
MVLREVMSAHALVASSTNSARGDSLTSDVIFLRKTFFFRRASWNLFCVWTFLFTGIWRRVVRWKSTDISGEICRLIFMVESLAWMIDTCFTLFTWLAYSSTLKMEAEFSSETSDGFQRAAWRHILEDVTHQKYRFKNLKSYVLCTVSSLHVMIGLSECETQPIVISYFDQSVMKQWPAQNIRASWLKR